MERLKSLAQIEAVRQIRQAFAGSHRLLPAANELPDEAWGLEEPALPPEEE
jgi:hypothetical protein